ncbi:MAG: ABC transporter ATP-binding protein [Fimbriimonadaceae bacterium]|nr:ABC transporter ATP-binding protein [Chthonomonadaceae bacterium]MCO5296442.1 ABC transporter ATP-binding protein [Fimbriimonadaceae bacterium]
MLAVRQLGKRFGSRWLFRDVEFDLLAGQALVVLGANGSGKSTLLRTIAGLVPASVGSVEVEGPLGMSTLELALYPQLTAEEHLEFSGAMRGCDPRIAELLSQVGLEAAAQVPAGRYSTGMKARLRMAMAIQHRPKVLLLDEPGAGLDEKGRALTEAICATQRSEGVLVLATNDPSERRFGTHELELGS